MDRPPLLGNIIRPLLPLLITGALGLQAATIEARYSIAFWVIGHVGTTTLKLTTGQQRYRIEANATLEGIAALLAHHHSEHFLSEGHIDAQGRLIPERYRVLRTMDDYRREQLYRFGRNGITLYQHEKMLVTLRRFDPDTMRYVAKSRPAERRAFLRLPYPAEDDLLTLYFNARPQLESLASGDSLTQHAAGTDGGEVHVTRRPAPYRYSVQLDQDIFRSARGEMEIETDEAYYVKNAVLKDVLLFGDLEVEREWLRQSP
ncbi:DUF3108 domain-containing protein [Sulfurimonas sp. HSL-1656]|uniref:DUF3108 domain-containing protein n=1 Tax=Thiomicrolovo subterrani TaxID=3131934 RepID=UPI0031F86117